MEMFSMTDLPEEGEIVRFNGNVHRPGFYSIGAGDIAQITFVDLIEDWETGDPMLIAIWVEMKDSGVEYTIAEDQLVDFFNHAELI